MINTIRQVYQDLQIYGPYCIEETKATLHSEVSSTRLNWLWWILTPLLQMLVSFGIVLVLLLWYRIPPSFTLFQLIPLLFLLWLITFGLSACIAHIGVYWEDVNDLLPVLLRLWMYFTGIFYSIQEKVPGLLGYWLLRLNPLAYILEGLRQTLLFHEQLAWSWYFLWLGISLLLCLAGIKTLYRNGSRYLKVG